MRFVDGTATCIRTSVWHLFRLDELSLSEKWLRCPARLRVWFSGHVPEICGRKRRL